MEHLSTMHNAYVLLSSMVVVVYEWREQGGGEDWGGGNPDILWNLK